MVDFAAVKNTAKIFQERGRPPKPNIEIECHGPISQSEFLSNLFIEARLAVLLNNCLNSNQAQRAISAFERLVEPEQMGSIYKALAIVKSKHKTIPGF